MNYLIYYKGRQKIHQSDLTRREECLVCSPLGKDLLFMKVLEKYCYYIESLIIELCFYSALTSVWVFWWVLNNKSIIKDYEGIFFSLIYYTNDKDRLNNDQFTTGDYIITLNAILLNKFSFMSTAPWIFFFLTFTLGASFGFLIC